MSARFPAQTLLVILAVALLASGCVAPPLKPAIQRSDNFRPMEIEQITLLPILDGRLDTAAKLDTEPLGRRVEEILKNKKYAVVRAPTATHLDAFTPLALQSPTSEWIQTLPPSDGRWVMLLRVDDVNSKIVFGSVGSAELSGYLFDKKAGEMVWHDKGIGRAGQGGLLGMAMLGMMESAAMEAALGNLTASIPKREPPTHQ
jgi:hypothetical protein